MACESYLEGQCTWGCCLLTGWIPEGLGDAGDWAFNAPAHGLTVTDVPTAGSVVSYCRGDGYSLWGHCAYVREVYADGSFLVTEMNYVAWHQYNDRISNTYYACGFILPPGGTPGGPPKPPGRGGPGVAPDAIWRWDTLRYYWNVFVQARADELEHVRGVVDSMRG